MEEERDSIGEACMDKLLGNDEEEAIEGEA